MRIATSPGENAVTQAPLAIEQRPEPLTSDPSGQLAGYVMTVAAGFPSPATDYLEDGIDLNAYLVRQATSSFLFRVKGDSMLLAGIIDEDRVIVDRAVTAKHGHIVVAVLDGQFTLKRLFARDGVVELRPENPAYAPIRLHDGNELQVWGVMVGLARRCVY